MKKYINMNTYANTTLTTEQIDLLHEVAYQCPFTGGNAVFQARGMLALIDTAAYNDSLICGSGYAYRAAPTSTINRNKINTDLKIYPNPANTSVSIQWYKIEKCEDCTLFITNIHGKIIYSQNINNIKENAIKLNCSQFVNGVYVVSLKNKNKLINKKLIIHNE